jgi:hypothetical protein
VPSGGSKHFLSLLMVEDFLYQKERLLVISNGNETVGSIPLHHRAIRRQQAFLVIINGGRFLVPKGKTSCHFQR